MSAGAAAWLARGMPETPASNPVPRPSEPSVSGDSPEPGKPPREVDSESLPGYETVRIRDVDSMKALAHPARMAVFDFLGSRRMQGRDGATATEIAEAAGMTPSAMSYHLRTLAKAGFIEEAPSRGDARERVWRLGFSSFSIRAREDASEGEKVVERTMAETFFDQYRRHFQRWMEIRDRVSPELREAATSTSGRLRLTPEEAAEYRRRHFELEAEYARLSLDRTEKGADSADGTVVFHMRFDLFPEL